MRRRGVRSRLFSRPWYPIALVSNRFGGFDDHGGGLDDRHGETAGLQFQFTCGLGTHQRYDGVRALLPLDLCLAFVAVHVSDKADKAIARGATGAERVRR